MKQNKKNSNPEYICEKVENPEEIIPDFIFDKKKSIEFNLTKICLPPVISSHNDDLLKLYYPPPTSKLEIIDGLFELKNNLLFYIFKKIRKLQKEDKLIYIRTLIKSVNAAIEFLNQTVKRGIDDDVYCDEETFFILNKSIYANSEIRDALNLLLNKKSDTLIESPPLSLKDIPHFNLQQRFYLFEKLGFDKKIHLTNTEKQTSKHKLLALLMGISPENAKHLINNTYKEISEDDEAEINDFLLAYKIKL